MVDVDCLQFARAKIFETVGLPLRPKDNIAYFSIEHMLAHIEAPTPFDNDESLIIGVNMKPWPVAWHVIAIRQNSGVRRANSSPADVRARVRGTQDQRVAACLGSERQQLSLPDQSRSASYRIPLELEASDAARE